MDKLCKSVLSVRELKVHVDDDWADRWSRQYTLIMSVFFAVIVSAKEFVGNPINCWCPAEFTPSQIEYANSVCWVSTTYALPITQVIPHQQLDQYKGPHNQRISYYQWVPFILLLQGVVSFVPCQIWRFLNKRSGINLGSIMETAHSCSAAPYLEIREKAIRYIVNQMDRYLLAQREYGTGCCIRMKRFTAKVCCIVGGRLHGNYLITWYLFIKVLYISIAIGQVFMLNLILMDNFHLYGYFYFKQLLLGKPWNQSDRFPRVTLCEFQIRHQSRLHNYVVQCALTINLFNEMIFCFIWVWFMVLAFVSFLNFLQWLFRALYWPGQVQYVRKQLRAFDTTQREPSILAKFTENYLRRDGMFIIRLIGMNMGEVVAGEVLSGLWNNFSPEKRLLAETPGARQLSISYQNGSRRMEVV